MATLTIEEMVKEAFSSIKYPAQQLGVDETAIPASDEMKVFGKMSVPQANIHHWISQLGAEHQEIIGNTTQDNDLTQEEKQEVKKIFSIQETLNDLMWTLIKEQFPNAADHKTFSMLTILPDWQVAGVYLTDEDRRSQKAEMEGFKNVVNGIMKTFIS